jgi:hypothetical protein
MKIKKRHLQLAVGALALAVAWSAWSYARGSGRPPGPAAGLGGQRPWFGPEQPDSAQPGAREIDPASIPPPPSVEGAVESASPRDPFLFGDEVREVKEAVAPVGSDPFVRSILFSSSRRLALIENRIVGVGDRVGDFKVVQIDRDAVTFATPTGERRRVTLRGPVPSGAYR